MKHHFPCIACGLCCANAHLVPQLHLLLNEEKQCRYWDRESKKCRIYPKRPDICNTSIMYDKVFSGHMSEKEYVLANLHACYALNEQAHQKQNMRRIARLIEQTENDLSF